MKNRISIVHQIFIVFITFTALLTMSFYFYFTKTQKEIFENQFNQKNKSVLETVKIGLEIGLQNENFEAIQKIFDWVKTQPDFEWIGIKDSSGIFFAQYPESHMKESELLKLNNINMSAISYSKKWQTSLDSGIIYINFSTKSYKNKKEIFLKDVFISSLFLFVIVILGSVFISILLSRPIVKLQNIMNKVAEGDFNYNVEISGNKEISNLAHSFHFMMDEIQSERKKSESLLLNILPKAIANRLKKGEVNISDSYPDVSILFADLVGFTELSSKLDAHQLVEVLNEIFTQFDLLCEKYNIEKIKTIGDCYMAASNLPNPDSNSALNIVKMAKEMIVILSGIEEKYHFNLQIRIGINTGRVVAGVIGKSKFIYDLWGDAVNLASRLESHGMPGKIQISESTFELVKNKFAFEDRGLIKVKGKGDQRAYLVI
ncbi:MAG: adenylate/guanylate cyclase domain-containing protein [Bacteriovorax sp.]|nr:adenylate/guanylate cyclase domain-containing protein [Bacteriovorax sp.]